MPRTCAIPDCEILVKPGKIVCQNHKHTPAGRELINQLRDLTTILKEQSDPSNTNTNTTTRNLRRKIERGDLHPLLESPVALLAERNAVQSEILTNIAVNHIALMRLLDEPTSALEMSTAVTRHSNTIHRLLKLRRSG